ncbi:conserved unknown protein [Ectocarpus siliculosus]|uniref:Adenine DNA glycosylase n=1 Tax=Ectocarpus siliculosus TaxID=2880 RepID=D7FM58_ECTSI|nr:conserved unknown protein [Ectocarpus siliculosus]|eukprot:CBJ29881.1 conserved unknown protein [Ectocarpus siliculosus]
MMPRSPPKPLGAASYFDDIEELPAAFVRDYRQHQAVTYHAFTAEEVTMVRQGLLSWYDETRRRLPWRGDPPPWTRTSTPAASAAPGAATGRKGKTSKSAKEENPAQPRLTAFFGSKPKQQQQGQHPTEVARKRRSTGIASESELGLKQQRQQEGNDVLSLAVEEEQPSLLKRIPMSAYGTWVSEVMLQQTRVETVIDYYVKWMTLFPTPNDLAAASLEQVNKAWAGLGYYRRAKMLHEGAKKVVSDHSGCLPGTAKELKDLPGIGPYTAGAVASIAFGECEPLVDGNVIRVLARLRAIASDPKNAGLNKLCWDLAGSIVDPGRPGDFNQALMELGATVCTVKNPSCSACPVRTSCFAKKLTSAGSKGPKHAVGEDGMAVVPTAVTDFPRKAAKTLVKDQALSVSVVERDGPAGPQVLLVKRPETGLLAGQWECPCVMLRDGSEPRSSDAGNRARGTVVPSSDVPEKERLRLVDAFLFCDLGLSETLVRSRASVGTATHVFSHLRHTMQVERIEIASDPGMDDKFGTTSSRENRWVDVSDMGGVGITTGMKKVLALASKARASSSRSTSGAKKGTKRDAKRKLDEEPNQRTTKQTKGATK